MNADLWSKIYKQIHNDAWCNFKDATHESISKPAMDQIDLFVWHQLYKAIMFSTYTRTYDLTWMQIKRNGFDQ